MAVFQLSSAGLLTTGTTGNDYFDVASSTLSATSIQGLAGNDTVVVGGSLSSTAVFIDLAGGIDSISITSGDLQLSTIKGGAGADTIVFTSGGLYERATIDGGNGNDLIQFNGSGALLQSSRIVLGGGVDTLTIESGNISNSFIGLGAGDDSVSVGIVGTEAPSANLAEIFGGGGNDIIRFSGSVGGAGLDINGDSSANGGGNDTITFDGILSGSTVRGKGGADVIDINGTGEGTGSEILGNAGGDIINVSGGLVGSANLVGAGSGNDTIIFSGEALGSAASIKGGGGADSITITFGNTLSGGIYGGIGADSITLASGTTTNVGLGFAYESLAESTISKMDGITAVGAHSGGTLGFSGGMTLTFTAITKTLRTGAVAGGNGFASNDFDGILSGASFSDSNGTAAGLTARVALLDQSTSTLGQTFLFEATQQTYLFIQGGSTGTADDLVAKVASGQTIGIGNTLSFTSGMINIGA